MFFPRLPWYPSERNLIYKFYSQSLILRVTKASWKPELKIYLVSMSPITPWLLESSHSAFTQTQSPVSPNWELCLSLTVIHAFSCHTEREVMHDRGMEVGLSKMFLNFLPFELTSFIIQVLFFMYYECLRIWSKVEFIQVYSFFLFFRIYIRRLYLYGLISIASSMNFLIPSLWTMKTTCYILLLVWVTWNYG